MLTRTTYNPDVLSCLANLSSDEVFTPPGLANQVLDMLPLEIWHNPNARFLDPVCKTGVFLREIAKRLNEGLKDAIPDQQQRLDHIYTQQVFGIAITELTSFLSRRSLYCSKKANGKYSVCGSFKDEQGKLFYPHSDHTWVKGTCRYCGGNEDIYYRNEQMESYAYPFIHEKIPAEVLTMQFDVIVGNPPYQLSDGGFGTSAMPIYQLFVNTAKKLNPRYLTMIIPARWYSGGKGLDSFRDEMLNDGRIRSIVDFPEAIDCFPGVQIKGGVCYFLWDRDNPGLCKVSTSQKGNIVSTMERPLLEKGCEVFIRYNESISILKKVQAFNEPSLSNQVSSMKPFGLRTFFKASKENHANAVCLYQNGGIGYVDKSVITKNNNLIEKFKVLIPRAGSGSDSFPHTILGKPFVAEPGSACTETYVILGVYDEIRQCQNLCQYVSTRFFRFLVLLIKSTQDASSRVYSFVPIQNFFESWNDEKLYKKYGLDQNEINFIESMIRPMELVDGE